MKTLLPGDPSGFLPRLENVAKGKLIDYATALRTDLESRMSQSIPKRPISESEGSLLYSETSFVAADSRD